MAQDKAIEAAIFSPFRLMTHVHESVQSEARHKMLCLLLICQKISMILNHSHWVAFVVLAAAIFFFI